MACSWSFYSLFTVFMVSYDLFMVFLFFARVLMGSLWFSPGLGFLWALNGCVWFFNGVPVFFSSYRF